MLTPITRKQAPLYLNTHNGGIYAVDYQAPAGAGRAGIPHDDKTDIMTLRKLRGKVGAPGMIVTSLFDFEERFRELTQDDIQNDIPPTETHDHENPAVIL